VLKNIIFVPNIVHTMGPISLEAFLPDDIMANKMFPFASEDIVVMPNELIPELGKFIDPAVRKLYYIVLSKLHCNPDAEYIDVSYDLIFTDIKNIKRNAGRLTKLAQCVSMNLPKEFIRLHLGGGSTTNGSINLFPKILYNRRKFMVYVLSDFKLLFRNLKNPQGKGFPYTKGYLPLLLELNTLSADMLYWHIRKMQFKRRDFEKSMEELKLMLGKSESRTNNFIYHTLPIIKENFRFTWTEFDYKIIYKGKKAYKIKFYFDNDDDIRGYIKKDLTYQFEVMLYNVGYESEGIMYIRKAIMERREVVPGYIWNSWYVITTIAYVENERAKGNIKKDLPSFLNHALFHGVLLEKKENNKNRGLDSGLGIAVSPGFYSKLYGSLKEDIELFVTQKGWSYQQYIDKLKKEHNIIVREAEAGGKVYLYNLYDFFKKEPKPFIHEEQMALF
jgi:hypothetical protein